MRTNYLALLRIVATVAILTTIYYLLPDFGRLSETSWALLFAVGLVVLSGLIVLLVGKALRAGPDVQLQGLGILLCIAVMFFAEAYFLLAKMPGQFDGLRTKTDALYFTVTTLSTVGYGDVHAAGQLARVAVILQVLFNLVFLGTAVTVAGGLLRTRATRRLQAPQPTSAADPSSAVPDASAHDQTRDGA